MYSCQKEDDILEQTLISQYPTEGIMKLGKQLENPYSVENMSKAYDILTKSNIYAKTAENGLKITTTHLYVKFIPKNENELSILKRDSTLVLYPYPLDFEIEEEGDFYRDPEIPEGQPTYQYCAIKKGKKLPSGVENEILEELFIPDEDKDIDNLEAKRTNFNQLTDALVDEALRITNNIEEESKKSTLHYRRSKWRPSGKITMDDDILGDIGIRGLKVRARRWFTTHIGFTDSDGKFECDGRFRGKARYKLDWERHHFALRKGGFSSAQKTSPRERKKPWNWHITSGEHKYYATIFRAAYHYYYQDIKGLSRPKLNTFWKSQLRIGAWTQDKGDKGGVHQSGSHFGGLVTGIKIYRYGANSQDVYATTIHELAHSSHYELLGLNFFSVSTKVKESWARGVQWELTRMVYPEYKGGRFSQGDYTTIVSDLIDGNFDYIDEATNNGYVDENDQVSEFTIKIIEHSLKNNIRSWNEWRDRLIGIKGGYDYNNNITRLFAAYE